jgi:hypothetical protein
MLLNAVFGHELLTIPFYTDLGLNIVYPCVLSDTGLFYKNHVIHCFNNHHCDLALNPLNKVGTSCYHYVVKKIRQLNNYSRRDNYLMQWEALLKALPNNPILFVEFILLTALKRLTIIIP